MSDPLDIITDPIQRDLITGIINEIITESGLSTISIYDITRIHTSMHRFVIVYNFMITNAIHSIIVDSGTLNDS